MPRNEVKPIPGMVGRYSITKRGRVFSHLTDRFIQNHKPIDGRLYVDLRIDTGSIRRFRVDALVSKAFNRSTMKPVEHRPVPGYDDYLLTERDDVYSSTTNRYLKPILGYVNLSGNGKVKRKWIPKLVREAFPESVVQPAY